MHSFEVRGGKKLKGEIIPQGAKNEALQIISAVLLTPEKITITNIPDIVDVNLLIECEDGTATTGHLRFPGQ
jgi:UDP-N-acetylglucosamine 1-carboxyvinyltransferase